MTSLASVTRVVLVGALAILLAPACSLGQGQGDVSGTLDAANCWSGPFDLHADFFAADPSVPDALTLRIQNGSDFETFSDGLSILVDDAGRVRGDPAPDGTHRPSLLGTSLAVGLSPAVTPPGVPVQPVADPPQVHATMYLERTCRTQDVALYAVEAVSVQDPSAPCGGAALSDSGAADAGASGAGMTSTIVFNHLFDGDPNESNASQRLSDATFDLYLADPREVSPGGLGPPPPCRGHLQGNFHFYFQRGTPLQPFP